MLTMADIYRNDRLQKASGYLVTRLGPRTYNIFNAIDKSLHRIRRKIIGRGLSEKCIRRFEPTMMEQIDLFIKLLAETGTSGEVANMTERCKRLGMDVIGHFGFGSALDLQTDSQNRFMIRGMAAGNYRNNTYIQFPGAKYFGIDFLMLPFLYEIRMKYFGVLKKMTTARLAEGKNAREDLFSFVVDAKDPDTGVGLRLSELWSEATFLFPAGMFC